MVSFYNKQLYIQMRRKCYKLREFSLNGAKANSTHIGTEFKKYFVVGDSANNTRLFDFQNDEQLGLYSNHSSNQNTQVTAVALGYYEKQIFSGTNRGMIHIWDMQTAKSTGTLKGSSPINCFGIFPQQPDMLASGSCDSSIKVWDIREKNATAVLKGHTKQVNSIAISPDGSMLLSGSQDNSNRLWDFRNIQRPIFISNEHNGPILRTRFNPEDCFFATSSMDKTVKYFRCEQKCFGFVSSTAMISLPPTGLCFSEDGKTLFTAANDVLKSWNMLKNGLLVQTFETNWKGVQDMTVRQNVVTAISFAGTTLNLWVCDLDSKLKNNSRTSQQGSFVLPKINRQGFEKGEFDLSELQNIVGNAIQKVNSIEDKPTRDRDFEKKEEMQKKRQEFQKKRQEMQKKKQEQIERKRSQMEKRREQMEKKKKQIEMEKQRQRQRILLQKLLKEKDQKQKKEQQRLKKLEQEKKEQERLYQERVQRQKLIQQRVKETFQNHNNTQNTQENDILQDSTLMRLSNYVPDRDQKQKLKQFELIEDIIKEKTKYECILLQRSKSIGPILSYWKNGKVSAALDMLGKVNYMIKLECITAILTTPLFKQGVSPEVGTQLTSMMNSVMITEKNSTFVKGAMDNINTIVLLFKDELIKIKTFNPMTRVDLSREERLAKYDRLIDQFLNVFKQQRLIKYYKKKKSEEQNNAFCTSAYVLYKNLEQVLIKILPKQEPQLA